MLKADAQGEVGRTSPAKWPALAGIVLALVLPVFLAAVRDWDLGGVTRGPLDGIAVVALFSTPAALALLATRRRPVLFAAAAATSVIAVPMWILAPPMLLAAVLWARAAGRVSDDVTRPTRTGVRELCAVVASSALVLAAAGTFFFVRSPMVCRSVVEYADGTVRKATKVVSEPHRHSETAPYQPPGRILQSQGTECSTAELLPERSIAILALLGAGLVVGSVFSRERTHP